jgi:phosphoribosylamine-glycine ligase
MEIRFIGSGGREHALAWKAAPSESLQLPRGLPI